ncbi:MAG: DNA-binding transcriptional regulator [Burkholderiales bacterium]|nr:DNA-binding transcriptional regulator [Burkholderiales bacterium]
MPSFPPVQSVVRAIELLQALNRQPVSTIDALHRQTGIPKPSLVRLLQTFEAKGLVRHAPQPGAYLLASGVATLTAGYHGEPLAVEVAAPLLDAAAGELKWPLTLAVVDGDAVVVRYSTIPKSPLSFLHSSIGMRLSMASQALGRAVLAHCTRQEQRLLLEALARSSRAEDALARDGAAMRRMIAETRRRGYALRDASVRPESNTLALPVFDGRRPVASIGLTWFASTMTPEEAVRRYLPRLRGLAAEVTAGLKTLARRRA